MTPLSSYCPCGVRALSLSRGVPICSGCKRIEDYLEKIELIHFFTKTREEVLARMIRNSQDRYLMEHPVLLPAPPLPVIPEGKLFVIRGYTDYILPLNKTTIREEEEENIETVDCGV